MDTQASDNGSAKFNKDDEAEKILKQGHLGTKNILSPDIRRRIAIAISKLNKMAPLWKSQSTELKWRTLKACIFPVAIYGCEAWTISKTDEKKITSFEMKCYRKILRISWTERKTNASVLEQLGVKAPQLLNLIKKQKLSYFGHIKRHNLLEKLFLEGTCDIVRVGEAEGDPEGDGRRTLANGWESRLWRLEDKHLREGSSVMQFGRPRPLRIPHRRRRSLCFVFSIKMLPDILLALIALACLNQR